MKTVLLDLQKMCVVSSTRYSKFVCFVVVTLFGLLCPPLVNAQTTFSCADVTEIPAIECEALVALYNSTDGDNWGDYLFGIPFLAWYGEGNVNVKEGWLQTSIPCSWHGVVCSDSHVVGINKEKSSLSGELPAEIGDLTNLTELTLDGNQLTRIPAEIENLTHLAELGLGDNKFTTFPAEILNLSYLIELDLSNNELTRIPVEIKNLTSLETLFLSSNELKAIPTEIEELTSLTKLSLSSNGLSFVPSQILNLSHLTELNLSNNELTRIPVEIKNLTSLETLFLSSNELKAIPTEIEELTSLTKLNLSSNRLSIVPAEILNATHLTELDLSNNQLTGLPVEIENLAHLSELDLEGNEFTTFPAEISSLINLTSLDLNRNQLTRIPAEISSLINLTSLDLNHNQLTMIPAEIGSMANLEAVMLYRNELTAIPAEIGNLTNLDALGLGGNLLTTVPVEIGNLTNLEILNLSENQLTTVPVEIGNLTNLEILNLHENQLTAIPVEIGNLTNLTDLHLSSNQLTMIPAEIENLSNLTNLGLEDNKLTTIPVEIGNLSNLTDLNLSSNQLTVIPAEIGNLSNLAYLDLRSSQLTVIPVEIGNLSNLTDLSLGGNQLMTIPVEIGNLNNLTQLGLSDNQLTMLPAEIGNLINLQTLNVHNNRLTSVPVEIWNLDNLFGGSPQLDGNQLTTNPNAFAEEAIPDDVATISFSFHMDSPLNSSFRRHSYAFEEDGTPIPFEEDELSIVGVPIEASFLPDEYTFIITSTNGVTQSISSTVSYTGSHGIGLHYSWAGLSSIDSSSTFDTDWERVMGVHEQRFGENFLMVELSPNNYTFDVIETELLGRWAFDETIRCIKRRADLSATTSFEIDRGTEFALEAGDRLHCGYMVKEHLPDGVGTVQFAFDSGYVNEIAINEIAITGYDKISDTIIFSDTVTIESFFTYYSDPAALPVGIYEFRPILWGRSRIDRTRCYTGREQAHAEMVWESNLAVEILDNQLVRCDFWLRPAIIDPSTLPFSKDFGDLPDVYSTVGENAPHHELVADETQIMLGSSVTTEPDGKPAVWAWGDDDDDGVDHLGDRIVGNYPRRFSVSVLGGVLAEGASLGVWIDWDYNNRFDEDEFSAFNVTTGENKIEIAPTDDYHDMSNDRSKRFLVTRFRLFSPDHIPGGTLDWTDYEGAAVNGEIEDYVFFYDTYNLRQPIEPTGVTDAKDFGDLPNSYSTTGENAPSHQLVSEEEQIMLGKTIISESAGQPDVFASPDDDDGSGFSGSLVAGVKTTIYAEVTGNIPSDGVSLGIWLDWNNNGQFSEDEFVSFHVRYNQMLISVTPPDDYSAYSLAVRFRLFSPDDIPGGTLDWTDYEGAAVNGEIEDYFFASKHPYRRQSTSADSSSGDAPIAVTNNPDATVPDIEFGECVPAVGSSSNASVEISAQNCLAETRSAEPEPTSVHVQLMTANKLMSKPILLNIGVLAMGLCVLTLGVFRYGRIK